MKRLIIQKLPLCQRRVLNGLESGGYSHKMSRDEALHIEMIRQRVRAEYYLIKSHTVQHALKEGFEQRHIEEAILTGEIIEAYPDAQRVLICGRVTLNQGGKIYLHTVCEYADPVYVEIVTAYILDSTQWDNPSLRRRKRKR